MSTIQQRVPTLPTPTTLRAMSTKSELLEQGAAVGLEGPRVQVQRLADLRGEPVPFVVGEQVVDPLEQRRVGA